MRKSDLMAAALATVVLASPAMPQSEARERMLLFFSHAECLHRNASQYLEFVDGPTLIFPGFCEDELFDPSPTAVAELTSENAFRQSSILVRPSDGGPEVELPRNEKATAVVLTEEHFLCLDERFYDVVTRLQQTLETGEEVELAEIFFDLC